MQVRGEGHVAGLESLFDAFDRWYGPRIDKKSIGSTIRVIAPAGILDQMRSEVARLHGWQETKTTDVERQGKVTRVITLSKVGPPPPGLT